MKIINKDLLHKLIDDLEIVDAKINHDGFERIDTSTPEKHSYINDSNGEWSIYIHGFRNFND